MQFTRSKTERPREPVITSYSIHYTKLYEGSFEEIREIFSKATRLRPWFPAIQMENCLRKGVELLKVVLPECLITDNSGIAFEAQRLGIKWIAGPQCNITNSYSLKCLKEYFNCSGSYNFV